MAETIKYCIHCRAILHSLDVSEEVCFHCECSIERWGKPRYPTQTDFCKLCNYNPAPITINTKQLNKINVCVQCANKISKVNKQTNKKAILPERNPLLVWLKQ